MACVALGIAAFILFFLYDCLSIKGSKARVAFFVSGCVILCAAFALLIADGAPAAFALHPLVSTAFAAAACICAMLLIHALVGDLPTREAYLGGGSLSTRGLYALCRHPGALCFLALMLCIWGLCRTPQAACAFCLWGILEFFLVCFEDHIVFPRTICGYGDYCKSTPFIMPSRCSAQAFVLQREAGRAKEEIR